MPVCLIDYVLTLETGESVRVAELVPGLVPGLSDPSVVAAAEPVLGRCPRMPRHVLESAKAGHSREFEVLMGTPPVGCLLKLERPVCAEIRSCLMANPAKCTTKHVDPGRRGAVGMFPPCWELEVPDASDAVVYAVREIASEVVSAWKAGQMVVIVEEG